MKTGTQRFKKTVVARALITAFCGTASMMIAQETLAQTASSLQRVEITGSNIRRTDAETASPVQVITKEDIDQAGKGTVAEYLQTLTADSQGSVPFTYGRGFAGATAAGISLRGLGANATLVLVNGRRIAPAVLADDAQRSFTDLNQIPLEAVERVEVLKDGASSIYGSDAVAGVVNIILKKNYVGTVAKLTYGVSGKGDGNEPRAAITHGFGDMEKDGYNVLLNLELGKKDPIYYRDRDGNVGASALSPFGYDRNGSNNNLARLGGNGVIPVNTAAGTRTNNSASQSIIGNVRNPATLYYWSRGDTTGPTGFTQQFPGAQAYCNANRNLTENDPGGGCTTDMWRHLGQVQPAQDTASFFGRFSKQINANMEGFIELGYYQSKSKIENTALVPSGTIFFPNGDVVSNTAATQLGASHPDNPYFGTAARLSYNPGLANGPNVTSSESHSWRLVAGLKGTFSSWDYDTAFTYSEGKQTDTAEKRINWRASNALLNPTAANIAAASGAANPAAAAYNALPAGSYWRIGENAGANSAALMAALLQDNSRSGFSKQYGIDGKISREFGQLEGGPIGVAIGAEWRKESNELPLYPGLGNYIGLSLTGYGGERDLYAVYTEALFPVTKRLELNAAIRYDHYSDAGSAVTPKVGAKFKAMDNLAFRGTYAFGFRAPSSTENSASSIAAFGGAVVDDNVRCAAGVADSDCLGVAPTFVQRGNPSLEPEKSRSTTLGAVWDITPKTSLTIDAWQIKRTGLPVIEDPQEAVNAGRYVRDPSLSQFPGDPGPILTGFVVFQNSAESITRGIDLETKSRWDLGNGMGRVTAGLTWSHLLTQRVIDSLGVQHDYAGTHGDCNITNCMGSPRNRISANATWDMGKWRLGANLNYRGSFANTFEKSDTACGMHLASGADAPEGCKIKSFTTLDVSGAWKVGPNTEVFGSIQNLFDTQPTLDPTTYGALGYNPLDYSGAIGRYFRIGVKHKF
ncbi:MAG: TonB-dependent receptor [Ramlibacter sp.]|nr:TonB-dependent receptor [Ramlibacter sp.]